MFIKVLKKLGDEKKKLPNEMDVVSSKLKNVGYEAHSINDKVKRHTFGKI